MHAIQAAAASAPFGSSSRRATVDGAEAAENGNGAGGGELSGGESPQATPSRKRPVMSPVAATVGQDRGLGCSYWTPQARVVDSKLHRAVLLVVWDRIL